MVLPLSLVMSACCSLPAVSQLRGYLDKETSELGVLVLLRAMVEIERVILTELAREKDGALTLRKIMFETKHNATNIHQLTLVLTGNKVRSRLYSNLMICARVGDRLCA
jgi:hypothetical protein